MESYIQKVIVTGAGVETSNGIFTRNAGNNTWFYSENGSHLEPTADGWYLIDSTINDQTYLFSPSFRTVTAVGDAIEPVPFFELVYSE